jgi:hypothetical protein
MAAFGHVPVLKYLPLPVQRRCRDAKMEVQNGSPVFHDPRLMTIAIVDNSNGKQE